MNKNDLRRLLSMICTPDTDPDTFEFVLKRISAELQLAESEKYTKEENENL